jgi:lipopolysaccharide export system permease protein
MASCAFILYKKAEVCQVIMSLFSRYLFFSYAKTFLLMQLSWVFVFIVIDFVGNIRTWLVRPLMDAAEYYLNYLPHIVFLIMPVAVMLSAVAVVGAMAKNLELAAMVGAGRSMVKILSPLVFMGVLITGLSFLIQEKIVPDANHRRLELVQVQQARKSGADRQKERTRFVFIGENKQTFYFGHYSARSQVGRDVIILLYEEGVLKERFDASKMKWTQKIDAKGNPVGDGGYWKLYDGIVREFTEDGAIRAKSFRRRNVIDQVKIKPSDLLNTRHTADEMDIPMIRERIAILKRTGEPTAPLQTQLYFKYSGPLISFFMLLIGAAVSNRYSRQGGLSKQFGVGLLLIFSYYVVVKIGLQMGETGVLSPFVGAWIGNLIFGSVAVILYLRTLRV